MVTRQAPRSRRSAASKPREARAPRRHLSVWLAIGVIVAVAAVTYANSLSGRFIFDDVPSIERNESIRQIGALARIMSPPRETPVAGRPIVNLSLAINYGLGGFELAGYHLWNLAIHVAAALTLFGIVRRTL